MVEPSQRRYLGRVDRLPKIRERLPREIPDLLKLCDGVRTTERILEESGLEAGLFDQVIRKLEAIGLLTACDFSQDDEDFFARPVDDLLDPAERPEPESATSAGGAA